MNEVFDIGGYSFMNSYADFQRSGQSSLVGSVIKGGKYEAVSKMLSRMAMTPKDRFIDGVQTVCREEEIPYLANWFEVIGSRHPHPDYLNAKLCVFAVQECLNNTQVNTDKFLDPKFQDRMSEKDIDMVDLYRYATMVSLLLQNK